MNLLRCFGAALVLGMAGTANAGLFDSFGCEKSCDCTAACQPECCAPAVGRPPATQPSAPTAATRLQAGLL